MTVSPAMTPPSTSEPFGPATAQVVTGMTKRAGSSTSGRGTRQQSWSSARMLVAGEDPRFIARRLMILASEDIGMAAPGVLQTCVAAAQAAAAALAAAAHAAILGVALPLLYRRRATYAAFGVVGVVIAAIAGVASAALFASV